MESIDFTYEVEALLKACELPVADLTGHNCVHLFSTRREGVLAGVIGIEVHGYCGLIRSLAVRNEFRNDGIGQELVAHVEAWALGRKLTTLYLLTTTAERFFQRSGYEKLSRSDAPEQIKGTTEFSSICPASASFMGKDLVGNNSANLS